MLVFRRIFFQGWVSPLIKKLHHMPKVKFPRRGFPLFLVLSLAGANLHSQTVNTAIVPAQREPKFLAQHEEFLREESVKNPDVVFVGDSITDGWRLSGLGIWEKTFEPMNALNLGIDGDRTQHVLWRIEHGEFDHIKPKVLVLMIGTNNTAPGRNTTQETIEGVTAVVHNLRKKLPHTKILLLAIFPRGQKDEPIRAKVYEVNKAIKKLDDGKWVQFFDIGPKFLEADGTLSTDILPDLLHPNEKGYQIWADAITPRLKKMLK